jgi:P-type conjugative transfer protein TrbG
MKRVIGISFITILLTSCATKSPEPLAPAQEMYVRPPIIQVRGEAARFNLVYGNDPSLERAFNQYTRTGRAPNIITDGFVKFAYNQGQQPIIKTNPFQETVISLEPGEKFTNVSSGDPARWSYSAAVSGAGSNQQQNILVKPSMSNITTNMVITTDRRIYNLKLIASENSASTKSVSFWYPDEMVNAMNAQTLKNADQSTVASVPNVSLNNLNFNYKISSDVYFKRMPSWKPTRVFDDGTHTYIQFNEDIANKDMPALFIETGDNKELVNYRVKMPYFVVDKIFKKAVLVMGIGSDQSKVIIVNNCYS